MERAKSGARRGLSVPACGYRSIENVVIVVVVVVVVVVVSGVVNVWEGTRRTVVMMMFHPQPTKTSEKDDGPPTVF
jgi:hypothetical protein